MNKNKICLFFRFAKCYNKIVSLICLIEFSFVNKKKEKKCQCASRSRRPQKIKFNNGWPSNEILNFFNTNLEFLILYLVYQIFKYPFLRICLGLYWVIGYELKFESAAQNL